MKANCIICQKEFQVNNYLLSIGKGKYCSRRCYYKSKLQKRRNTVELKCKECGETMILNQYHLRRGEGKYCSKACLGIANGKRQQGKNHWNWKGGISPRVLTTIEYKQWRTTVFERDGYKCVICGYDKGRILQADHIKSWHDYPELRFDVNNGRTLCKFCHIKTSNYGHH